MEQQNSFPCSGCGIIFPEESGAFEGWKCEDCVYDKILLQGTLKSFILKGEKGKYLKRVFPDGLALCYKISSLELDEIEDYKKAEIIEEV